MKMFFMIVYNFLKTEFMALQWATQQKIVLQSSLPKMLENLGRRFLAISYHFSKKKKPFLPQAIPISKRWVKKFGLPLEEKKHVFYSPIIMVKIGRFLKHQSFKEMDHKVFILWIFLMKILEL